MVIWQQIQSDLSFLWSSDNSYKVSFLLVICLLLHCVSFFLSSGLSENNYKVSLLPSGHLTSVTVCRFPFGHLTETAWCADRLATVASCIFSFGHMTTFTWCSYFSLAIGTEVGYCSISYQAPCTLFVQVIEKERWWQLAHSFRPNCRIITAVSRLFCRTTNTHTPLKSF